MTVDVRTLAGQRQRKRYWGKGGWPRGGLQNQGRKYGSSACYYRDVEVHPLCDVSIAPLCRMCCSKIHKRETSINARLHCRLCAEHDAAVDFWYDSKAEARTAERLDGMLRVGEIVAWRRARPVVLQPAIKGVQRAITYKPDFVVSPQAEVTEVWEIKGSAFTIADDARLKIKMYRALAAERSWPPLRILDGKGRLIHV